MSAGNACRDCEKLRDLDLDNRRKKLERNFHMSFARKYLSKISKLCNKNNILLIVDEVQAGNGKTGKFFAYLHENIICIQQ